MGKFENLFVKTFEGPQEIIKGMMEYHTVRDLKEATGNQVGQDPDHIRLVWNGKELNDMETDDQGELLTLKDYDIVDEACIHMIIEVPGGSQ